MHLAVALVVQAAAAVVVVVVVVAAARVLVPDEVVPAAAVVVPAADVEVMVDPFVAVEVAAAAEVATLLGAVAVALEVVGIHHSSRGRGKTMQILPIIPKPLERGGDAMEPLVLTQIITVYGVTWSYPHCNPTENQVIKLHYNVGHNGQREVHLLFRLLGIGSCTNCVSIRGIFLSLIHI